MKKNIKMISVVIALFILIFNVTACKSQMTSDVTNASTTASTYDASKSNDETEDVISPITNKDFIVSNGKDIIELGSSFDQYIYPEAEEKHNYVGQLYNGDQSYDVYQHSFEDFVLYASDMYRGDIAPDSAPYIIEQIDLKTPAYKTERKICIGLSKNDVLNAYGKGTIERSEDDNTETYIEYSLGNKTIEFDFDKDDLIIEITLYISVPQQSVT